MSHRWRELIGLEFGIMQMSNPFHDPAVGDRPGDSDPRLGLAATAADFGMPLLDLSAFDHHAAPEGLVEADLVRRHRALPLRKSGAKLFVAVADPSGIAALDQIKHQTRMEPVGVLVESDKLDKAIERYRSGGTRQRSDAREDGGRSSRAPGGDTDQAAGEPPVVRYVHETLADAIEAGASDVHFEPYENAYRIRVRVDGILREVRRPPMAVAGRLAARLKVMSQMDITERRIPQDGRIKLDLESGRVHGGVNIRVSTLPTLHGEKIVLRILDPSAAHLGIDSLGFEDDQGRRYLDALDRPQGMVLVTGPTGSGKTVTLYAGLNRLNAEDRNVATVEDPVEINVEGINQVQVNTKVGLDFATALRAFLRQDPDVVMVGEIRDLETAEIAIKAAQTGHLVLSTLHTNTAAETLTRLRTMGVPAFNLATSVTLITAQRLARLLCRFCRRALDLPPEVLLAEGCTEADLELGFEVFDANDDGCEQCDRGYSGRTGIHEVIAVVPEIQRLLLEDRTSIEVANQARLLGYEDLRRVALKKVMGGLTSLREVNRVTARG